ncbi:MAG: thiamine-phosphate kinase [Thermoanaerobaculia bacterium]
MKPEDRFVERLRALLPHDDRVLIGPGDDAAVFSAGGGQYAVTTDMLVESVDFLPEEDPESIGRRAIAVNLSDLAAMGARPEFFLLSIAFPPSRGQDYPLAVARGALSRASPLGVPLVGGDLSRAPAAVVSVALWGCCGGVWLTRSGARSGDLLFLSGFAGRAAAGLRLASRGLPPVPGSSGLLPQEERELVAAYRDPEPRIALGLDLARERLARAAIDVSDGLGVDAARLARCSGVQAVLERERIPVSPALAAFAEHEGVDPVEWMLAGGDDYELLFTAPETALTTLLAGRPGWGVAIARIGFIQTGQGAVLRDRRGAERDIAAIGHDHFEARP